MTNVVVDIGRLVVHGAGEFASDVFADSLRREIAQRMGGAGPQAVAQTPAVPTVESRAAAAVATQLFARGVRP